MEESGKLSPGVSKIREIKPLGNPFYLSASARLQKIKNFYARITHE